MLEPILPSPTYLLKCIVVSVDLVKVAEDQDSYIGLSTLKKKSFISGVLPCSLGG